MFIYNAILHISTLRRKKDDANFKTKILPHMPISQEALLAVLLEYSNFPAIITRRSFSANTSGWHQDFLLLGLMDRWQNKIKSSILSDRNLEHNNHNNKVWRSCLYIVLQMYLTQTQVSQCINTEWQIVPFPCDQSLQILQSVSTTETII